MSASCDPMNRGSARLLCPWDSPGKNIGVGCHFLLQGIFPTQELNPGRLHYRQIPHQLSYEKERKKKKVKSLSCVQLFETLWTVAYQAPPSMEFSRREYWSGLPISSCEIQG